ncbi:DUF1906 domain-containing protein [Phaeacidiphilus oryzae]|uniref:DUF1906 domain-containing protein n=1 Tax=Phaeacidiphilus oryzae TaxID=348818 RepID=UPI0007C835E7|nr:DUF1906 domain-containing protein [Phaeacidiphilus oryzae]
MRTIRVLIAAALALCALVAAAGTAPAVPLRTFRGTAFDTCSAPKETLLRAWWGHSPYRATGVYIGGAGRACRQPRLDRDWVRTADRIGWRLLPVYAGSQAPCATDRHPKPVIDPRHAPQQGGAQGADAVRNAAALGIRPGSPIFLDMENYRRGDRACTTAVLRFTAGWASAVRARGYRPGYYGSAYSGIADLAAAPSPLVDEVWYARWDAHPDTGGFRALPPGRWSGRHRVHQYRGPVKERYAGAVASVDRDAVDSPVAIVG